MKKKNALKKQIIHLFDDYETSMEVFVYALAWNRKKILSSHKLKWIGFQSHVPMESHKNAGNINPCSLFEPAESIHGTGNWFRSYQSLVVKI